MNLLQEKGNQLDQKRQEWKAIYDGIEQSKDQKADIEKMQALNAEMDDLGKEFQALKELEVRDREYKAAADYAAQVDDRFGHGAAGDSPQKAERQRKSVGEQFIESLEYKNWGSRRAGQFASVEMEQLGFKTTFTTTGSAFTGYERIPGVVLAGTQRLTVADLLPKGQTNQNTIRYPQEVSFTNAATTVAEGATKPEAAFSTIEVDAPVRKIAVTAKVTDELFMDFPALRDYINARLPYMVKITEEAQILNGDGNAPNLRGILQTSGILTQARGADSDEDAMYKGITKVRFTGFFEPDGVVVNPNNWQTMRLHTTTTGEYIWGPPSAQGPETLWGLPVVVTSNISANTGLVGAFALGAQLFYRNEVVIESTNSNEDDFKKNLIAIRAEERVALPVYRPAAFASVTGLN